MKQTAVDDIIIELSTGNGASGFFLRIASRHGNYTMPRLLDDIKPYLKEGVNIVGRVETPSRFAP
jgi:hypothetical protein